MAVLPSKKGSLFTPATVLAAAVFVFVIQGGVTKIAPLQLITPAGSMMAYAGASTPVGFLLCDGQAVSRSTYSDLFTAIGTTWGVGNGSTTFNVPDMREASPYGAGTYSAVAGTTHGTITAHDARALGAFADDQGQGHLHNRNPAAVAENVIENTEGSWIWTSPGSAFLRVDNVTTTGSSVSDGTNGTPRTGTVTRGKTIGVNYIIKY